MLGGGRLKKLHRTDPTAQSIFGVAVTVTGDLDSEDPIRIDGMMEGDIRGTVVTVTRNASVTGAIRAAAVRVEGAVDGLIEAATVVVTRHARVTGQILCEMIEIEAGAAIGARCRAWCDSEPPAQDPEPPKEEAEQEEPAPAEAP